MYFTHEILTVHPEREVRAVEGRQASFDRLRTNGEVPVHPEREVRTVEGRQASFDRLRTNGEVLVHPDLTSVIFIYSKENNSLCNFSTT